MKKMSNHIFLISIILLSSLLCASVEVNGQKKVNIQPNKIREFQIEVGNSNYASGYAILISINNTRLNIYLKGDLDEKWDSLLFSRKLLPSDTLQKLSLINIDSLKSLYSNRCIDDGSQVTVIIKRDKQKKSVHLSNYYREDVEKIIILVNSMIPDKYKVWYDKEKLLCEFENCK